MISLDLWSNLHGRLHATPTQNHHNVEQHDIQNSGHSALFSRFMRASRGRTLAKVTWRHGGRHCLGTKPRVTLTAESQPYLGPDKFTSGLFSRIAGNGTISRHTGRVHMSMATVCS